MSVEPRRLSDEDKMLLQEASKLMPESLRLKLKLYLKHDIIVGKYTKLESLIESVKGCDLTKAEMKLLLGFKKFIR